METEELKAVRHKKNIELKTVRKSIATVKQKTH